MIAPRHLFGSGPGRPYSLTIAIRSVTAPRRQRDQGTESKTEDIPEITPEMIEAGEAVICGQDGIAPVGWLFSPRDLAEKVYRAIEAKRCRARGSH